MLKKRHYLVNIFLDQILIRIFFIYNKREMNQLEPIGELLLFNLILLKVNIIIILFIYNRVHKLFIIYKYLHNLEVMFYLIILFTEFQLILIMQLYNQVYWIMNMLKFQHLLDILILILLKVLEMIQLIYNLYLVYLYLINHKFKMLDKYIIHF